MGIKYTHIFASEPKQDAREFVADSGMDAPTHTFADIGDAGRGTGWCHTHGTTCPHPDVREDLYVTGLTCQPLSELSPNRWGEKGGSENVVKRIQGELDGWIEHLRVRQPYVAILENVSGMVSKADDEEDALVKDTNQVKKRQQLIHYSWGNY